MDLFLNKTHFYLAKLKKGKFGKIDIQIRNDLIKEYMNKIGNLVRRLMPACEMFSRYTVFKPAPKQ